MAHAPSRTLPKPPICRQAPWSTPFPRNPRTPALIRSCGILSPSGRAETELARQDASHWKSRYESAVRDIEYLRTVILMLGVFCFVVVIWCVTLDLRCADIGFFRGEWNFVAVFSMVCFAIAALMVVLFIIRVYRRHRQRKGENE